MRIEQDVARVALQSVAASLLAYYVMSWFQLEQLSWAVIASLFSIHASLDSTFGASFYRILGAILGAALGFALVVGFSGWELMPLRIALIAALTNGMAALRPNLDYAAAAGAVVALQPTPDMEGAAGTALAVGIGGLAGTLASVAVWPQLSRHRAQHDLASAVRLCQQLVDQILDEVRESCSDEDRQKRSEVENQMLYHLQEARSISANTRFKQKLAGGATVSQFADATERLWYSLIIVERVIVGRDKLGPDDHAAVMPHFQEAHKALCELLSNLAEMISTNTTNEPDQEVWERFKKAQRAAHEALSGRQASRDSAEERLIQTLLFGLDEISRAVAEFQHLASKGEPSQD